MSHTDIPSAMARQFSETVQKEIARWNAMEPAERVIHYEQQIAETEQRIADLEAKPIEPYRELHRQIALEMLNHDLATYRESADYYRNGGLTLKQLMQEAQ